MPRSCPSVREYGVESFRGHLATALESTSPATARATALAVRMLRAFATTTDESGRVDYGKA